MSTLATGAPSTETITSPILAGYVRRDELAKMTGKSARFWYRRELDHTGPPVVRIGSNPYYRIAAVREWLEAQEQPRKVRSKAR